MKKIILFFSFLVLLIISLTAYSASLFVGDKVCASCHSEQYQKWKSSHHYKSMALASSDSVVGEFSGNSAVFHNVGYRFYQEGERYFVTALPGNQPGSKLEIKYTFGFYPLQQYLVETSNGKLQALNLAWDNRSQEDGGQRWFHLRPEEKINKDHLFYWERHFQNWNSRCSECHSTGVWKGYSAEDSSYQTEFSSINVSCEACHGAAGRHVALAKENKLSHNDSGFDLYLKSPAVFRFQEDAAIAFPVGEDSRQQISQCGVCHSLRVPMQAELKLDDYFNHYRMQSLHQPSYFSDGKIKEEVFVLGSFMQSKMYQTGVSCGHCHDVHSGNIKVEGNGLCAQCHKPSVYDVYSHHKHLVGSDASQCVNCHMPSRTYMGVDDRRDHSFSIPRLTNKHDGMSEPVCLGCHKDESLDWLADQLKHWPGRAEQDSWPDLNYLAQKGDKSRLSDMLDYIEQDDKPEIRRAALLSRLPDISSQQAISLIHQQLSNNSPVLRRAAVEAVSLMPYEWRWHLLLPNLNELSPVVRYEMAIALSELFPRLSEDDQSRVQPLIDDYREVLALTLDSPTTQLALAELEANLGNFTQEEAAYREALKIEPVYIPAMINLADYYRRTGQRRELMTLLDRALNIEPGHVGANYSYGLYWIRQKAYAKALPYLEKAKEESAQYGLVYALALEKNNRLEKAIEVLVELDKQWPNNYQILLQLIRCLEHAKDLERAAYYMDNLRSHFPDSPGVQRLIK